MSAGAAPGPAAPAPAPSDWLPRWAHLIAPGGRVLDVACGSGRHLRWLHDRGHRVTGVDRDADCIAGLAPLAAAGAEIVQADIETGPWPFAGRAFDAVLVANYLWRPRLADVLASVAPGGLWIHETFAQGQESIGRPARAEFLLAPGELLDHARAAGLRVIAYEDGFVDSSADGRAARFVQRIVAARPSASGASDAIESPPRHPLQAPPPRQ